MDTDLPVVITIDGPSGAGKGTLSQMLASYTGYHLLDSGALYRLVALAALNSGVDLNNEQLVAQIASTLDVVFKVSGNKTTILLVGRDVTSAIRQESVSMAASQIAAYPAVRAALLERQREFAVLPGLIADGRDMGTTVFPAAQTKLFLTASAEARAERRYKQLIAKGDPVEMTSLIKDIQERDERDSNRAVSPLRPAEDAIVIDSTSMTIEQVFAKMLAAIGHRT
ncbi:cytidylate kinase [Cellvibrio mixtus]|jgi:cytidylate kinase|uniref:Cytidylate kinase n=1 Tax=Cellvibrio mixtus TaxID=39650 RepID=A0A266Q591_9GAMM|nr:MULTISPECIES: (d)CMP kinase [Cellvibrio]AQT59393.1 cytidylate kinase [Cellvibrio sp. PSBB023]OZY85002.1 cytidylate kinase [Cellvibrio mixtus]